MKTALLRLGAMRPAGRAVSLTNTAGLLAHLFPLGAPPLAVLLLLQTGALQGLVAACRAVGHGGNRREVLRAKEREAKDTDAALLNVLARVLYPMPLFHGATAEEAAATGLQVRLAGAAAAAADADACIDAEVAGSPLPISEPRVAALVGAALKSLLRPEFASALPGVAAAELLRRPLNPFVLRFYASATFDTLRRDLEADLGVSDAVQYAVHSEMGRALKALGFALAARLAVAGVLPVEARLLRHMFHGGSDEGDEEEEEEEEGNHRAPRKKAVMDDFHEAVIEKCADLDRAAVAERFGEAVLQELDMALALLNLAGRFREKFSQVRARRRSRRAPRPLAQRAFTPHPSLLPHQRGPASSPCGVGGGPPKQCPAGTRSHWHWCCHW
jgi:hypothetical protein